MTATQALFNEFKSRVFQMEKEVERRQEIINYLSNKTPLEYEDIICAMSWLDHTTKTADEIIEILENGE